MSLLQTLGRPPAQDQGSSQELFATFGVIGNPFPPAGQPGGHPHLEIEADKAIFGRIQSFTRDRISQVVVVEGEQGVGKTNILAHYDAGLRSLVASGQIGQYVVRYYADPEPSFEGVLNRLFQELGEGYVRRLAEVLATATDEVRSAALKRVRNQDVITAFQRLTKSAADRAEDFPEATRCAFEWVIGQRLLNRHRAALGVHYRIDTLEAKTQALRDLVELGRELKILDGIFLLLDELEKQDYTTSKSNVLRFLLAIRALIDALPESLFLMVALTPTAKNRYFQMVPAVQSRMQNSVSIKSFSRWEEAQALYRFYVERARERARAEFPSLNPGTRELVSEEAARASFAERREQSRRRGLEGVTPRDFLDELHGDAEGRLTRWREQGNADV